MVEEDIVSGEGWISDESSLYGKSWLHDRRLDRLPPRSNLRCCLYSGHTVSTPLTLAGDEEDQIQLDSPWTSFNPKRFWSTQKADLNVLLASSRTHSQTKKMSAMELDPDYDASTAKEAATPKPLMNHNTSNFLFDRRAMEEARLARQGPQKREPSPYPVLFNPGQGSPDAWQLGESVDDFVRRLPPFSTSISTCTWIWAHNPHFDVRDKNKVVSHRVDELRNRGSELLGRSLQARQELQSRYLHGPKAALTQSLNAESKILQQRINDLAVECGILSGKWMLFPKLEEVTAVWKKVVDGVINDRLGPSAKVAPDEGKPGDRLICIYTKDFRDECDVLRVLQVLEMMDLLTSGRSIYYKSDAFTYLDLYKQTASGYGLQASLYTSYMMMAAAKVPKASSSTGKKQTSLNSFF
ncbi:hypothetical protein DE146DRAFT_138492 [Phaeosphaeria sp. MPI-PUGE-AT-0046c]|nr:hypothetical protein DE146DRAFT_138492 [Phaeosphaeria sp. MPI-PUGE-AT-0046c]